MNDLGQVEEHTHLSLKQNFNSETVFFYVLKGFVTLFDFAILCE